jgi:hypothetical protein
VAELIQHSNLTKHLKDDKDKKCNRSNNAEIKTTAVKDIKKRSKKIKFNSESRNQSVVKQKKEAQKIESRAKLLVYRKNTISKRSFTLVPRNTSSEDC